MTLSSELAGAPTGNAATYNGPYSLVGWKLTLPVNDDGAYDGNAEEILQTPVITYSSDFFVRDEDSFKFICPDGGATTSTATYARTELRHLTDYAWNTTTEDKVVFSVDNIGDSEKTVVFQIHDTEDPEFKIVYTGKDNGTGYLRILYKATEGAGDTTVYLKSNITNGDVTSLRIKRSPSELQAFLDGNVDGVTPDWSSEDDASFSRDGTNGNYYWKRGNYYQETNNPKNGTLTSTVTHHTGSSDGPVLI